MEDRATSATQRCASCRREQPCQRVIWAREQALAPLLGIASPLVAIVLRRSLMRRASRGRERKAC
eukprot:5650205-Pyramimonas_sp.AAC.1